MKAFVVDASVALKWILLEEHSELALVLLDGSFVLHVPNLVFAEFGNTLWKKSVRGELTPPQIDEAIALFQDVPLRAHRDRWLLKNATRITREKITRSTIVFTSRWPNPWKPQSSPPIGNSCRRSPIPHELCLLRTFYKPEFRLPERIR